MAINSNCDECSKSFPHSVSDYTRVCGECQKSRQFTLVLKDRINEIKANWIISSTIIFDEEISLRDARIKCSTFYGETFIEISAAIKSWHIEPARIG